MSSDKHLKVRDLAPIAKGMTAEAFAQRYPHPFLFGREVLEEEFQFSTLVTNSPGVSSGPSLDPSGLVFDDDTDRGHAPATTDVYRIRHWIIPVKKPAGAAGQDRVFLGRAESNDICVPHKTVSKLHAYFVRDADIVGRWFLVDTGSANGTKTNGAKVPGRARVSLMDGDSIAFGRCVFQWLTAKSLHERLVAMAD
mgnify:CR=1 FL=1